MQELDEAILQMRANGAPGPDDFPSTFLKALGPRARQELLDIFNLTCSTKESHLTWKIATILLPKKA